MRSVSKKKKLKQELKKRETSLDGTVMSMLNFGGLGPARASKSSNITTGKTVVTILMTTCNKYEECFAVFSNFNIFMAGGAIADVLPLGTGVAARVRDNTILLIPGQSLQDFLTAT